VLACPCPTCQAYDPAFAYELAVIIEDGIRRMYVERRRLLLPHRDERELRACRRCPRARRRASCKGLYRFRPRPRSAKLRAQLLRQRRDPAEALKAPGDARGAYGVAADVWSVTSYKELHRDGHAASAGTAAPGEKPRVPYVAQRLAKTRKGPIVAASDYVKALPDDRRWLPRPLVALGTDGFGRSEGRAELRDFFEVDARRRASSADPADQRGHRSASGPADQVPAAEPAAPNVRPPCRGHPRPGRRQPPAAPRRGRSAAAPAAPSVRRYARELGVDISQVTGQRARRAHLGRRREGVRTRVLTSFGGRQAAAAAYAGSAGPAGLLAWGDVEREPMSGHPPQDVRAHVAAWNTIPHVTQFDKADITDLEQLRKRTAPSGEGRRQAHGDGRSPRKVVAQRAPPLPAVQRLGGHAATERSSTRSTCTSASPSTPSTACSCR
jgi:hypothetical protein